MIASCGNCSKYPLCNKTNGAYQPACENWIKISYNTNTGGTTNAK